METAITKNQQEINVPSFKDWVINILITIIPLVGFIFLIIWAVDSDPRNIIRKRWAGAYLMMMVIMFVLVMILWFAIFAAIMAGGGLSGLGGESSLDMDSSWMNSIDTSSLMNNIDSSLLNIDTDSVVAQ
jgi:magnesium-transporting ATPase (P-type)